MTAHDLRNLSMTLRLNVELLDAPGLPALNILAVADQIDALAATLDREAGVPAL